MIFKLILKILFHHSLYMQSVFITLLVILYLSCQAVAQNIATHESVSTVVSAMLYEPYVAAFLSLILLIATLI